MPERKIRIPIWFILIAVLLNIISRGSPQFAQYYVNYIFLYGWKAMEELADYFLFQWEK